MSWLFKIWRAKKKIIKLATDARNALRDHDISAAEARLITEELIDLLEELGLIK